MMNFRGDLLKSKFSYTWISSHKCTKLVLVELLKKLLQFTFLKVMVIRDFRGMILTSFFHCLMFHLFLKCISSGKVYNNSKNTKLQSRQTNIWFFKVDLMNYSKLSLLQTVNFEPNFWIEFFVFWISSIF